MAETLVTLTLSADHQRLPPGPARLHAVVELEAHGRPADVRPRLRTIFALDISGSMQGPPLEQVVRSVERLVELLSPDDALGVVAFSDGATEVSRLAPLTEEAKRLVCSRVSRLRADGNTNIEAALRLAGRGFGTREEGTRQVVLLLSDGQPTAGATTSEELAELARGLRPDRSVSVLGYGTAHDEVVLSSIADGGGGLYRFIPDPATCQLELAQALGAQADVVADGIEVVLAPAPGVEIARILGSPSMRFSAEGLVVPVADMIDGSRRLLVVELRGTFDASRISGELLRAQVRYRAAGSTETLEADAHVSVDVGGDRPVLDGTGWGKVLLARADEAREQARAMADRRQFDGAAAALRAMMAQIEAAPGFVAMDGSPLAEARELLLDEAMAMERHPSAEAYSFYKKASVSSKLAGDELIASSRPRSARSIAFGAIGAGLFPEAYLVLVRGEANVQRHRLGATNTIGRTRTADIVLASDWVSRRHADVFALEGEFWVADLGSSNTTRVNGEELLSEPRRLVHGDLITLGDIELRYEEKPSS